jgi:hypothetical protein
MGAAALMLDRWLSRAIPDPALVWQIVRLGASIAGALITLAAAAWVLRIEEFDDSMGMVLRRFRRRS